MEAQPVYSHYDLCQYQGCQCKTCGGDQAGICVVVEGGGTCDQARALDRCPVKGCPNWRAKEEKAWDATRK
jgi:hypothetical protein